MNFSPIEFDQLESYPQEHFSFMGHPSILVKPKRKSNGLWALKTEYFGAYPELEMELLNRGWHIAFNQNDNRWAEIYDINRKINFIHYVSETYNLSSKCSAVGMSCGGLYSLKLAELVPSLFSALYLDAPVVNLLSCPLSLGVRKKDELLDEYYSCTGRTVSEMLSYRDHPLDKMEVLVNNHIPVILVSGDSDTEVPYCENGALLEKYYKDNNGIIEVHIKEGYDHHPHGLPDISVIADFLERYA